MLRFFGFFFVCVSLLSAPARAAWHEASSDHFVIYADQKASSVKRFAQRLEKYHAAMAFLLKKEPETPSPSNRVTVFVVSNKSNVRKLANAKSRYTAGIYLPRAGNIVTIVPKLRSSNGKFNLSSETILRHEYAHHFLFNISNKTFPLWFQEGFAEFYASGKFQRDGTIILGGAANHRAYELAISRKIPIRLLLDTAAYLKNKTGQYDQFYGRSWLLYHYLTFDDARKGQMTKFLMLLAEGISEPKAAEQAFGDLDQLDRDLDQYARKKRITAIGIPPDRLNIGAITVRQMSKAEGDAMPIIMESRTGVNEEEAKQVVVDARRLATKYPDSAAVQEALAEAEFDAGYDAAAIAAADRALQLDPARVRAQIQKIYAYARRAESAEDDNIDAAWKETRKQVVSANRIENNHPIPLMEYYRSYRSAGVTPTQIAKDGLQRALELARFDHGLRLTVATQYMEDERFGEAAITLRPLAFNPHRGGAAQAAEKLLNLAETAAAAAADDQVTGDETATANAQKAK